MTPSHFRGVHSFLNGQFFAEVFGIGMALEAAFMNTWSMFESGGSRNSTDLGFLDGSARTPRSSYWHMQMIAKNFGGRYAAGATNLTDVRSYGCIDTGKVCVIILNMEDNGDRGYTVRLNTGVIAGASALKINIDAQVAAEYSDVIPNQTTQVLVFTAAGAIKRKIVYGITQARNAQPPTVTNFSVAVRAPSGRAGAAIARQVGSRMLSVNGTRIEMRINGENSMISGPSKAAHGVYVLVSGEGNSSRVMIVKYGLAWKREH